MLHENPPRRSRVFPFGETGGRTGKHYEAKSSPSPAPAPGPDTLVSNSLVPVHAMTTYQGTTTATPILKT